MPLEPIEPSKAVELYINDRSHELASETIRSHRSRLGHFLEWCEEEDVTNMNDLTGRKLHEYRIWRRSAGDRDPNTVTMKSAMDTTRKLIEWCETIDAVEPNLHEKVLSPSLSPGENERESMLAPDAGDAILEYLETYEYASREHVVMLLIWRGLLRRGGARAIDIDDCDLVNTGDPRIRLRHRPDTGTPLKNQGDGERTIGLKQATAATIQDYIDTHRHDIEDGRKPLLTTTHGRPHAQTVQADVYAATRPCAVGKECPHGRDPERCDAAVDRQQAYQCPSSTPPHDARRGAITRWLKADIPDTVVSDRCNTSPETLGKHYDQRSERTKQQQRRKYLDRV